jgi:DNA-3-methyladenine glycosylase
MSPCAALSGEALASALDRAPDAVARRLIGATLTFAGVGGIVVETEAYDADDPASHSFAGQTLRNAAMFGRPGTAYVYRSYGLHWCLNLVCGSRPGGAVLFRALQPVEGLEAMVERRGTDNPRLLCAGPGRLCQALDVTGAVNGASMLTEPFRLTLDMSSRAVACGRRIGISKAQDRPWRFGLAGSPYLSRRFG